MGLIIRGQVVEVPGLVSRSWKDDARLRLRIGKAGDGYHCGERRPRCIVLHTTKGIPGGKDLRLQHIKPGVGPAGGADACARWWSTSPKPAGAHLVVDRDGTVACLADLVLEVAYHAEHMNPPSIGIECYQDADAGIWGATIEAAAVLVRALCDLLEVPRQVPAAYHGGPLRRLAAGGGPGCYGVFGHRDCSANRGAGDPGDFIMDALANHDRDGFDRFDFDAGEDLEAWRERQEQLNRAGATPAIAVDGMPGAKTYYAMRQTGLFFGGAHA